MTKHERLIELIKLQLHDCPYPIDIQMFVLDSALDEEKFEEQFDNYRINTETIGLGTVLAFSSDFFLTHIYLAQRELLKRGFEESEIGPIIPEPSNPTLDSFSPLDAS